MYHLIPEKESNTSKNGAGKKSFFSFFPTEKSSFLGEIIEDFLSSKS